MDFDNRTAIVTGSSRGIGKAAALRLGRENVRVCVNHLGDCDGAADTLDSLQNLGVDRFVFEGDVSTEDGVRTLADTVMDKWGKIDILVSNAGISGAGTTFGDITGGDWDRMLDINLKSHFLMARAVIPHMQDAGYGRIVTMSSTAGVSSLVRANIHYTAAKGGLVSVTKRLARDFAGDGVTVNCVAPGLILDTGFNELMSDDVVASYVSQIPRGRPGFTKDVAGLVAFLSSDEADWITGQVIAVDGGATC